MLVIAVIGLTVSVNSVLWLSQFGAAVCIWLTHTLLDPAGVLLIVGAVVLLVVVTLSAYHNKLVLAAGVGAVQLPVSFSQKSVCVGAVGTPGAAITSTLI